MFRTVTTLLAAPLLMIAMSGCSSEDTDAVTVNDSAVVIDVRTPEEFAAGHLDGAQLLDLTGGEFEASLPTLDPSTEYLVYCHSGNRSGQAVALMAEAGFTDVTDLGSLEEAAEATSISIVS